jgi:hypothetical protein
MAGVRVGRLHRRQGDVGAFVSQTLADQANEVLRQLVAGELSADPPPRRRLRRVLKLHVAGKPTTIFPQPWRAPCLSLSLPRPSAGSAIIEDRLSRIAHQMKENAHETGQHQS